MPGYADTKKLIEDTLVNRPAGTVIIPEDHQTFALSMLDYIHSVELLGASSLQGAATVDTVPVQPLNSRVSYISSVPPGQTYVYTNFLDENGDPITVTSGANTVSLLTLLWNGSYWTVSSTPVTLAVGYTNGYLFKGIAVPTDNPGTPDQNVFYVASTAGTYTNFGGLTVADGEVAILRYNGSWTKDVTGAATKEELTRLEHEVDELDQKIYGIFRSTLNISSGWVNNDGPVVQSGHKYTMVCSLPSAAVNRLFFFLVDENLNTIASSTIEVGQTSGTVSFVAPSDYPSTYIRTYVSGAISGLLVEIYDLNSVNVLLQNVSADVAVLKDNVDERVVISEGSNLYNKETRTQNAKLTTTGLVSASNDYDISDYIRVEGGKEYTLTGLSTSGNIVQPLGTTTTGINFYDEDKTLISTITGENKTITTPSGAYYMRATINHAWTDIQVNAGGERVASAYNPVGGYPLIVKRGNMRGILHRGFAKFAPENTIPAFKLGVKNGFIAVETDVRFTSDGVPVLLHDASINRTARNLDGTTIGTTIDIDGITYSATDNYDFGIWMGAQYAGTKIPTFAQFLEFIRNTGISAYVELKAGTEAQIQELVKMAKGYGVDKSISWISISTLWLGYVVAIDNTARVGLVAVPTASSVADALSLRTGKNEVFISTNTFTTTEVDLCKSENIPLEVWSLNSKTDILALSPYVSGVTSDILDASVILYEESVL